MTAGSVSAVGGAGAQSPRQIIGTIQSRLRTWRADACILILGTACQCSEAPLRNFTLKVPYKLGGHHMYHPHFSVPLAVIVAGIAGASSAHATVRVGYAMLIERNVSGTLSGQQRKVLKGDDVFENDFISTETASSARLLFLDKTQLALGPTAIAKLDRLVFNPDQSLSALTVSARAGAIRWISGESASSAYQIETPTLTLRVHGTAFDLFVEPQRTTVVLQEGIVEACLIDAPQRCKALSRPGEMITATRGAIEGPRRGGLGPSDFEDRCLSAASNECVIGISVTPPSGPGGGQKRAEPRAPSNTPPNTSVAAVDPTPVVDLVQPDVTPPTVIVTPPIVTPRIIKFRPPKPPGDRDYPTTESPKGKGNPTPSTSTGHPTPTTGSDKGKGSAGMYKNNPQILRGSNGDNPRLRVNRKVAIANASVVQSKPATSAMPSGIGPRATSMVPRQSFTLMGMRRMGVMGAPRLQLGGMGMRPFGGMGMFRRH
jgi:FecR protein